MTIFYTSPDLAAALKEHGIGTTGTLKTTREGLPDKVKTLAQALNRSDVRRGTGYYIRERDSSDVYVCWQGNKCITVLFNSYPGNDAGTATRRTKDRAGRYSQIYVPLLAAIKYYNQCMGGVDTSDQLIGYHHIVRQRKRYWKTLFYHLLEVSTTNAFVLHKWLLMEPILPQKASSEMKSFLRLSRHTACQMHY